MSSRSARTIALGVAVTLVISFASLQTGPTLRAASEAAPCQLHVDVRALSSVLLLGEPVDLRIELLPDCPDARRVVLVLDSAGAAGGALAGELRESGQAVVAALSLKDRPSLRLGVAAHYERQPASCAFTGSASRAMSCLAGLPEHGRTELGAGIRDALSQLRTARTDGSEPAEERILVLTDAASGPRCDAALRDAEAARAEGVRLSTFCVGEGCDETCLGALAGATGDSLALESASEIRGAFLPLLDRDRGLVVDALQLRYPLPPDLDFVPGSAKPAPTSMGADGRSPTWRSAFVPRTGVRMELQLRPRKPGRWVLGGDLSATWLDSHGRERQRLVGAPRVLVLEPRLLPWD